MYTGQMREVSQGENDSAFRILARDAPVNQDRAVQNPRLNLQRGTNVSEVLRGEIIHRLWPISAFAWAFRRKAFATV